MICKSYADKPRQSVNDIKNFIYKNLSSLIVWEVHVLLSEKIILKTFHKYLARLDNN